MRVNRSDGRSAARPIKLVLGLAALLAASSPPARADARAGSIGATSSASVAISVRVAPRVRIVGTGPAAASGAATMVDSTAPDQLCLQSNLIQANVSIAVERPTRASAAADPGPSVTQGLDAAACVAIDDRDGSAKDSSIGGAGASDPSEPFQGPARGAVSHGLPQSIARTRSVTVLIAAQ